MIVTFENVLFLPEKILLEIVFPSDITITNNISAEAVRDISNSIGTAISQSTNTIILNSSTEKYYPGNTIHVFKIKNIKNPVRIIFLIFLFLQPTTKPTGNFSFKVRNNANLLYYYDKPVTYSASPGKFKDLQISPSDKEINKSNEYNIILKPQNKIFLNSYLKIEFPIEITISSLGNFEFIFNLNGVSKTGSAEFKKEGNKTYFYLKNSFLSDIPDAIISLNFKNVINFKCAQISSSFITEIFTPDNYLTDKKTTDSTVEFTEGTLNNISITPSSKVSSFINEYTINFEISNELEINSEILIKFPNDIIINSGTDDPNYKCDLKISSKIINVFTCNLSQNLITISNFNPSGNIDKNAIFSIIIYKVQNKRSLLESGLFQISTKSPNNCKKDKNKNDLKVKCETSSKIESISIIPDSNLNGEVTNYSIEISPGSKIIKGDYLKFSIPSELKSSSGNSLLILGNNLSIKTQIPNLINGFFTITIDADVNPKEKINFKILSISNNYSTKETNLFEFSFFDVNNMLVESYDNNTKAKLFVAQNSNLLQKGEIKIIDSRDLLISFYTKNIIPKDGIVKMKISPSIYEGTNLICESYKENNIKYSCVFEGDLITIQDIFKEKPAGKNEEISLKIRNVVFNSSTTNNKKFALNIETFEKIEQNYYSIDKIDSLEFTLGCTSNCAKCLSDQKTCTQCISSLYILKEGTCIESCPENSPFLLEDKNTLGKSCVVNCPNFYYADTTEKKCIPCQAPCIECESKEKCKNCQEGYLFYANEKSCSINCPGKSIKSNNICINCDSSCLTCLTSDYTKCLSCPDGKVLFSNLCINPDECPKGTVHEGGKCQACDPYCEKCIEKPSKCQKCISPYLLNEDSFTCYRPNTDCTNGYFLDNYKNCRKCKENCLLCESEFTCKICNVGTLKEGNNCVKNCSNGFFFDLKNMECRKCAEKCEGCFTNDTKCSSCKNLFFLHDYDCLLNCPNGFFADKENKICKKCESTCEICESSDNAQKNKCTKCSSGLFLSEGYCMINCPANYIGDKATRLCISRRVYLQNKYIFLEIENENKNRRFFQIYFLFFVFLILFVFFIMKKIEKQIFYFGLCCGFISLVEFSLHVYVTYLLYLNSFSFYFFVSGILLCSRLFLNNIFLFTYMYKVQLDKSHNYWISYNKNNHRIHKFLIFLEYKTIRLSYSRFLKSCKVEFFDNKFSIYSHINNIYRYFRYFDITIIDLGIFFLCGSFIYFTSNYTYLWIVVTEFLIIRAILLILTLFDFITNSKIDEDFFYQIKSRIDVNPYKGKDKDNENNNDNNNNFSSKKKKIKNKNKKVQNFSYSKNSLRRSNSANDLTFDTERKNKKLKELTKNEIEPFIPRDDFYLIKSIDYSVNYFNNLLKNNNKKVKSEKKKIKKNFNFYENKFNEIEDFSSERNLFTEDIKNFDSKMFNFSEENKILDKKIKSNLLKPMDLINFNKNIKINSFESALFIKDNSKMTEESLSNILVVEDELNSKNDFNPRSFYFNNLSGTILRKNGNEDLIKDSFNDKTFNSEKPFKGN